MLRLLQHPARGAGLLLASLCLLLAACASVRFGENIDDYQPTLEEIEQKLVRNPNDADALRDYGVIYLRTNNFSEANRYLQAAFDRNPDDPKTLFHLGLVNEALAKPQTALRLYARYPDFTTLNPYRRLMAGRYDWVVRQTREEAVQARVAEEQQLRAQGRALCTGPVEPRVVAVYPLTYQGQDERFAPLGRGLAELITVDLAQIDRLQLVERARLQDLLDEIRLAQGPRFDPATAPRVGCLIGAGRLVGGVYDVLGQDDLRLDASLWENDQLAALDPQSGGLTAFIALEKRLVYDVLARLGIEPTPEERQRIEFVPTQNLQAFLAYSRGLEREDAGAFGEAARFYQQAGQLDANFRQATDRAETLGGTALVQGTTADGWLAAASEDPTLPTAAPLIDPTAIRVGTLVGQIGATVVPGPEQSQPGAEAATGGVSFGGLPDPPPPPPRNDGGGN